MADIVNDKTAFMILDFCLCHQIVKLCQILFALLFYNPLIHYSIDGFHILRVGNLFEFKIASCYL